jgi:hypothetical protein
LPCVCGRAAGEKKCFLKMLRDAGQKERSFEMKLMSINKKVIAALMAVLMVAAVSTVSVFAIAPDTYTATLSVPSDTVTHYFTYIDGEATVTVSGNTATATIPVLNEMDVQVYLNSPNIYLGGDSGTVYGVEADADGYDAYLITVGTDENGDPIKNLVVEGPASASLADFQTSIIFEVYVDAPGDHGPFTALLTLSQ